MDWHGCERERGVDETPPRLAVSLRLSRRLEDRLLHLVDRFGDELGRVVDDVVSEAAREAARQILDRCFDAISGCQRVRAGTLEDQQRYGLALVEIAVGAVILRAELDAADVADARDPPIRTSSTRCIRLLLRL
jgi:hypothetical protein